jgi:hypothetical protein
MTMMNAFKRKYIFIEKIELQKDHAGRKSILLLQVCWE